MSTHALSNVLVCTPVIRCWSGQVALTRNEDLRAAKGLPPSTLVSDGSKRVIDMKALTTLVTQRRSVNRFLARLGVRSPMGYLINPDDEAELYAELNRRGAEFAAARDELLRTFDARCRDWESKNPGFETLLRRNRPSVAEVAAAIEYDYAVYKVAAADSEAARDKFSAVARASANALMEDVAQAAGKLLTESFAMKSTVTQRPVNVVRELVGKLRAFSMFDPRILPAANHLDAALGALPRTGPLSVGETMAVAGVLQTMMSPDTLLDAAASQQVSSDDVIGAVASMAASAPASVGQAALVLDPSDVTPDTTGVEDIESVPEPVLRPVASPLNTCVVF